MGTGPGQKQPHLTGHYEVAMCTQAPLAIHIGCSPAPPPPPPNMCPAGHAGICRHGQLAQLSALICHTALYDCLSPHGGI